MATPSRKIFNIVVYSLSVIMSGMIMMMIMFMRRLTRACDAIRRQGNNSRLDARQRFNRHFSVATRNFPRLRLLGISSQGNKGFSIRKNNSVLD